MRTMPFWDRFTIRHILAWTFRSNSPYTTCTPACSSIFAQTMLFSSSKRAFSSTNAATCLSFSRACIKASIMGECLSMR